MEALIRYKSQVYIVKRVVANDEILGILQRNLCFVDFSKKLGEMVCTNNIICTKLNHLAAVSSYQEEKVALFYGMSTLESSRHFTPHFEDSLKNKKIIEEVVTSVHGKRATATCAKGHSDHEYPYSYFFYSNVLSTYILKIRDTTKWKIGHLQSIAKIIAYSGDVTIWERIAKSANPNMVEPLCVFFWCEEGGGTILLEKSKESVIKVIESAGAKILAVNDFKQFQKSE